MHPHDVPDRPWEKVGTDLFTFDDKQYMVTVDYYSNFIEVDWLPAMKSKTVIYRVKAQFAHYGIPDIVMSENAPQYALEDYGLEHGACKIFANISPLKREGKTSFQNSVASYT